MNGVEGPGADTAAREAMRWIEKLFIEISWARPGTVGAYLLAALFAAAATLFRLAIDHYVVGVQFIPFFPAVMGAALISGFRAGVACIAISGLSAWYFFVEPRFSFAIGPVEDVLAFALFVFTSVTVVLLISAMRTAIERYRDLHRDMEALVEHRTAELMKTQRMLAQSQKMEAIGHLTGGLAHDFNNMLAVVLGNLDIMKRRLADGQTDIVRFLDNATDGVVRAAQLTQRLLAFARHQPLSPAVLDINKLTSDMSELLRRTLPETVKIECVLAGGLWKAHIDAGQLESAILNLAVNARDAMPEGGALTIETANGYLDEQYAARNQDVRPGQYVILAVTDTGTGMKPEVAARAIEPFFTTKEAGKGTGLGLSQVYGFVKQSGGHMAIYSEFGRGTTVRLYLPRASAQQAQEAMAHPAANEMAPTAAGEETILVVEDDDHVRRMSVAALTELGYLVHEAPSAAVALDILARQPEIKLLFTDVVMPDMNGRGLVDKALQRWPELKVLYTTGYTRNAIVHDGTLDADVALIVKPFTVDQLARKVRAVLDTQRSQAQAK